MSTTANSEAWARLEILLSAMHPGEVITVEETVVQTGIAMESAALVLDALVGAALFASVDTQNRQLIDTSKPAIN